MPKEPAEKQPIHLDDFIDTMEVEAESDRGWVLGACHVLDAALEHRLRSHLSRRGRVIKKAVDPMFETTRPLSTF